MLFSTYIRKKCIKIRFTDTVRVARCTRFFTFAKARGLREIAGLFLTAVSAGDRNKTAKNAVRRAGTRQLAICQDDARVPGRRAAAARATAAVAAATGR